MLSLHTKRKRMLTAVLFAAVILPFLALTAHKIMVINGVFAEDYPMPAGFSDQTFYNCVVERFKSQFPSETIPDTGLTDTQLSQITSLSCNGELSPTKIGNVAGIEKMTGLTSLDLERNNVSSINLSNSTALSSVNLNRNSLTNIDVSTLSSLRTLNVSNNQLSSIDVTHNTFLQNLYVGKNSLSSLNISNNPSLKNLTADYNDLTTLDVSNKSNLIQLEIGHNSIQTLNASNNPALKTLDVSFNSLTSLNLTNDTALEVLKASSNSLATLNLSTNSSLTNLELDYNQFTSLNLTGNPALVELRAASNQLTSLNLNGLTQLANIYITFNNLSSLNLSTNTGLQEIEAYNNVLTGLNLSNNTALKSLKAYSNQLSSLILPSTTTLTTIDVNNNQLTTLNTSNCTGITSLALYDNSLTSLDVSNNTALKSLAVHRNSISSMDISNNTSLTTFRADNIPVKMNISLLDEAGSGFSLSNLAFIKSSQTIPTTSSYQYNGVSKQLSILDPDTYPETAQISSAQTGYSYKIMLPMIMAYNVGGGTGAPETETCYPDAENGCTFNIPITEPTYDEKHIFLGWTSDPNGTTAEYQAGDTATITNEWRTDLQAVWSSVHTLTYDVNGGQGTFTAQTCYNDSDASEPCSLTIPSTEPTYENHVFLGWATNAAATTGEYQAGDSISINSDTTLTAIWGIKYTLNYDTAGGSGSYESQTCQANNSTDTTCTIAISNTEPTYGNYKHFLGWAESSSATTGQYQAGSNITMNGNKTIYARWTIKHYLEYAMNGGTPQFPSQFCVGDSTNSTSCTVNVNNETPNKGGNMFTNWSTNPNAGTGDITPGQTLTLQNDTTTLYATWNTQFKLYYDLDGGTGDFEAVECDPATEDAPTCNVTISSNIPSKTGKFFLGWATNASSTTAEYQPGDNLTLSGVTTLYARWGIKYNLSYNLDGGSGSFENTSCQSTETTATTCTITIPNTEPTNGNYKHFLGWAESSSATTGQHQAGATITMNEDKTLYARWTVKYFLNYNMNGAHESYEQVSCIGADTTSTSCAVEINSNTPTKDDRHFLGWAYDNDAETGNITPSQALTLSQGLTNIYAIWGVYFTLNYDLDGGQGTFATQTCSSNVASSESCAITIPNTDPTKQGYGFIGWAESSSATTGKYQKGTELTMTKSKTLYARWGVEKEITYEIDGEEYTKPCISKVAGSDTCEFTIEDEGPEVPDKAFLGWTDEEDGETGKYQKGDTIDVAEDTKLYPVYGIYYMIDFDVNGGEGEIAPLKCIAPTSTSTVCEGILPEDKPILTGLFFKGWAHSADATKADYKAGGKITASKNTTLYAVYGTEEDEDDEEGKDDEDIIVPNTGGREGGAPTANYTISIMTGAITAVVANIYIFTRLHHKKRFLGTKRS